MAEGEEEADPERPDLSCWSVARRVVDSRDVVGVEGVPQPEGVGEDAEPALAPDGSGCR